MVEPLTGTTGQQEDRHGTEMKTDPILLDDEGHDGDEVDPNVLRQNNAGDPSRNTIRSTDCDLSC